MNLIALKPLNQVLIKAFTTWTQFDTYKEITREQDLKAGLKPSMCQKCCRACQICFNCFFSYSNPIVRDSQASVGLDKSRDLASNKMGKVEFLEIRRMSVA